VGRPAISVIIPVYNVEKYLADCLESIIEQSFKDIEIICVNDGSSDNSSQILDCYQKKDSRVIVLDYHINKGQAYARNCGLEKATGEYVYFVDPDDLLLDNSLSVLLPKLVSTKVDVLMAQFVKFSDGEDVVDYSHMSIGSGYEKLKTGIDAFVEDLSPYECYIWRMLFRRTFLIAKEIEFKPFRYEDTLFCQECLLKAKNCMIVDNLIYAYRLRKDSFTSSMNIKGIRDLNSSMAAISQLRKIEGLPKAACERLMDNLFASFSLGLCCVAHNKSLYSEKDAIIRDLKSKVNPSLFVFESNLKQRFVSFMFWHMPNLYLKIRSII
jgi:glycosyltransferase involved in cell wall biosynthesis